MKENNVLSLLKFISVCIVIISYVLGMTYSYYGFDFFKPHSFQTLSYNRDDISDIVQKYSLLLIGGPHRAGTTLLWKLLALHNDTISFSDKTGVDYSEGAFLQSVYSTMGITDFEVKKLSNMFNKDHNNNNDVSGLGKYAFFPENHLTESSSLITIENRMKLINEWGYHWKLNNYNNNNHENKHENKDVGLLIEKTPTNMITSRFHQNLWSINNTQKVKSISFLFITRHPIAVALAHRKWSICKDLSLQKLIAF